MKVDLASKSVCRLCLEEAALCKSHIIPEFLFKPLYNEKHRFRELIDVRAGRLKIGQKGYTEPLLCAKCESYINGFERHVRRLFTDPLPPGGATTPRLREFANLGYAPTKLFFLSVLWRASISTLPLFKHVDLGPHEEKIRVMIKGRLPGKSTEYEVSLLTLMFEADHFRDFIPEPTVTRANGCRVYRFVLAGFVVFFYVSSHHPPSSHPAISLSESAPVRSLDKELREIGFLHEIWKRFLNSPIKDRD